MTERPHASSKEVDLQQFESVEDALAKIDPGDRYLAVARLLTRQGAEGMAMTIEVMFWSSVLTRSYGLHAAIAREIGHQNPHAVFPLVRSFAETMALLLYVNDHPRYVDALLDRPRKGGPKRPSPQALLSYASKRAPGMKGIYEDLSEATHFGYVAMYTAHSLEEREDGPVVSWTSYPRWGSDQAQLIACAHLLELAEMAEVLLGEFFERHIIPATA